jgi:hypothetical protein
MMIDGARTIIYSSISIVDILGKSVFGSPERDGQGVLVRHVIAKIPLWKTHFDGSWMATRYPGTETHDTVV